MRLTQINGNNISHFGDAQTACAAARLRMRFERVPASPMSSVAGVAAGGRDSEATPVADEQLLERPSRRSAAETPIGDGLQPAENPPPGPVLSEAQEGAKSERQENVPQPPESPASSHPAADPTPQFVAPPSGVAPLVHCTPLQPSLSQRRVLDPISTGPQASQTSPQPQPAASLKAAKAPSTGHLDGPTAREQPPASERPPELRLDGAPVPEAGIGSFATVVAKEQEPGMLAAPPVSERALEPAGAQVVATGTSTGQDPGLQAVVSAVQQLVERQHRTEEMLWSVLEWLSSEKDDPPSSATPYTPAHYPTPGHSLSTQPWGRAPPFPEDAVWDTPPVAGALTPPH